MDSIPGMAAQKIDLKDPKAFEEVYRLYWKKVFATCYNNIRETEAAKEMVQDIFKSLWERREQIEITVSIEHYLARAAKFKVFEYIRNKTTQQKHEALASHHSLYAANCTEDDVMYSNLKDGVDTLVDLLPTQCRRVFTMSRVEGMNNREIARNLLVSERAVEHHITKAIRFLKMHLIGYTNAEV